MITIGIDPHKSSHTAVALDDTGRRSPSADSRSTPATCAPASAWAAGWPQRLGGRGRRRPRPPLAQQLVTAGENVLDVPATLAARARLLATGGGRKTDGIDAAASPRSPSTARPLRRSPPTTRPRAAAAVRSPRRAHRRAPPRAQPAPSPAARSASRRRTTAAVGRRGRRLLRDDPAGHGVVDLERKAMARQLIADLRRIDRALIENRRRCAPRSPPRGSTLTDIFGISDVLAAKILGHTGDITRFASADHFASYTGTAPIEVSSGEQRRHRLSAPATARSTTRCTSRPASRPCTPAPAAPLPTQTGREQDPRRGAPQPQTTTRQGRLSTPPRRPRGQPSRSD